MQRQRFPARAAVISSRVGLGPVLQQRLGGEQESRRAVAALGGAEIGERLLQGVKAGTVRHSFDRADRGALAFDRESQAGEDRLAVDENGTSPAFSQLAPVLGAHEPEVLAEDLEQGVMNGSQDLTTLPVHVQPKAHLLHAAKDLNTCSNR